MTTARPDYPPAPVADVVETIHGVAVADPYRWLEDPADPRTRQWLTDQAALTDGQRKGWPMSEHFAARVAELLGSGSISPDIYRGARRFFTRRDPDAQLAVLYVAEGDVERVLIDPIALDPAGTTTLDSWQPSKGGDTAGVPALREGHRGVGAVRDGRRHRAERRRSD